MLRGLGSFGAETAIPFRHSGLNLAVKCTPGQLSVSFAVIDNFGSYLAYSWSVLVSSGWNLKISLMFWSHNLNLLDTDFLFITN